MNGSKLLYVEVSRIGWGSVEEGKFGHFPRRDRFHGQPGLPPGPQTASNHGDGHVFLGQVICYARTGSFANASAVQIDLLSRGKMFLDVEQRIRLQTDGTLDAHRLRIVVAMASDVVDHCAVRSDGSLGLLGVYEGYGSELASLAPQPN